MQVLDFAGGIEVDIHRSMFTSPGPQNLVCLAYVSSDFVDRQNGYIGFGIQQHGVGFFVVRRRGHSSQRVHPLWGVTARPRRLEAAQRADDDSATERCDSVSWR